MSRESAVSAIKRGDLSELQHVLEESEWDIGSEPLSSKGQTALHIACANGHLDIVQYLVNKKGCSVTVEDVYGHTPLMLSFVNKHWKMANFLLYIAPNSELDVFASYNKSIVMKMAKEALVASCKEGYFGLVKYIIESGWHTVDHKETQLARRSGNVHIVKYLLTHCQCAMPDDMSEVHIACIQGVVENVKIALDSNGSSLLGTADSFGKTPIHYATLEPNILRMIVQYAGEMLLNITDSMGNTPLHHSIKYECIESVTILVEAPGCDVNIANLKGETPLIAACKYSNSDIVQLLVASERCDPNICDGEENAPLHVTVSKKSIKQLKNVQCLLQSDRCDPNVINKSGLTPLHIVCHQGDIPLLKILATDKRCDLNIQDGNGDTALHIGVENVEVVKCLLESGSSRCDIYNEEGLTPFHKAITNGVMTSVEVMMKNGVNILQTSNDKFQNAPIHIACIHSRLAILKVLMGCANCDPNQQNAVGNTALHIVCKTGRELESLELQCILQSNRCDPNVINKSGRTPLHIVCHQGDIPLLEALVADKRCDLSIQDGNGDTALHIGVRYVAVVKCLLESGRSKCNIYNEKGLTPFHKAIVNGVMASVEVMMKNGVNILQTTNDKLQNAPIHIACIYSRIDILKVLLSCESCDPNQQNSKEDTALHIVCRMRTGSELQFLEVLTSAPGINPTLVSLSGNAAIHIACMNSRLDSLKVLLSCKNCDPNQQNSKGDTALHIVCKMKTGNELQFLEVLTSTPGINPTLLNLEGNAAIHIACIHCRLDSLKVLLSCESCNPNQQNSEGDTPLHIVCRMRTGSELQFLEVLISTPGINPTLVNHEGNAPCDVIGIDGNTLLHSACAEGKTALIELLVKNRANVLTLNHKGNAPIHIACMNSRLQSLKVLLSCESCDPNQQNSKGETALHVVCRMRTGRELQFLEVLTSTPGINPTLVNLDGDAACDVIGIDGNTLLHSACAEGKTALIELLVKNRANVLTLNHEGNAPIHTACMNSRLQSLKVLLSCESCDPNQQNSKGETALHVVCRMRTGRELQFLEVLTSTSGINPTLVNLDGNAACDVIGIDGNTLLHSACAEGKTAIVELLVKNRANVLTLNHEGNAPIHTACMNSRLESLKVLLSCESCDPNQQNTRGNTALHIVCRMRTGNELRFLEVLTSTPGINPILVNHEGITPWDVVGTDDNTLLHNACAKGNSKTVEFLVKNGADVLKPNRHGNAPIHIACMNCRLESLKVLSGRESCDPNQQNSKGDTALHFVSRIKTGNNELQFLEVLTSTPGINPTLVNLDGNAPIHTACMHYSLKSLKVLLNCESCDPNQQNSKGDTALHIVCRMRTSNELQFLEVLTSTPGINPTIVNHEGIVPSEVVDREGDTLLHNACVEGNIRVAELLLKYGADVLKLNSYGDAPIHVACKHSRLEVLKALFTSSNCNPDQLNEDGDTALHIVSRKRGSNEDRNKSSKIVEFLVKNGADLLKPNRHGDAPIHTACQYSRLDILKMLLENRDCDPNQQNGSGDMPLHIVCRMSTGSKLPFLKMLLSTPGINPEIANYEGRTPIEVAGINYFAIDAIKKFLEHKKSSIQAYLKIFVVGNSGNGKSTLIKAVTTEASQLRKYAPLSKLKKVNPSDVPPHTAGIVPTPFNSKHFGNAVLYDFAGQHEYYSSHAAVMENLILPSPPLFLLLINISKSKKVLREELVYWWHFINNQSQKAAAPPHVILAGSHKDMVKSRDREERETMIKDCIESLPVTFEYVGYLPLNCRKLVSQGLSALLTQLNTTCQTLRGIVDVNLHCHILNALLRAPEFQDLIYCSTSDIMSRIQSDNALLPQAFSQLIPLLASLNDQGHILLLQNHTDESKSWVILKPDALLTEVNGSIFAPKYFKEHSEFAMSTGVVPLSKLKEKFTEYNHEVIVEYLTHLEFCFRIKDQHTLDMITNNEVHESATTEEYYFFPSLVRVENPTDVCQPHQSIDYECGWLYKCSKETEQLTTRFLHVLILRLAFACDPPDDSTETKLVVLLRSCSVWKHGIAWWTNDGIEVIVEVGLQCHWVAVMLRCPATERVQCAELRSKVISTVLKTKKKFCPTITMKEYLIGSSSLKYPFEGRELTLYSMREVARDTIEGRKYARDTEGKNPITIPQLLPFEPYHNIGNLVPKFFSGDTSVAVTPEELTQLAEKCYDKLAELKTAFKPDVGSFQRECVKADLTEVEKCVALFHILQKRGRFKTWRDFQQEFSRFSIFSEQNPLVRITRDHYFSTYCRR